MIKHQFTQFKPSLRLGNFCVNGSYFSENGRQADSEHKFDYQSRHREQKFEVHEGSHREASSNAVSPHAFDH